MVQSNFIIFFFMNTQSVQANDLAKTSKRKQNSINDDDDFLDEQSLTSKFFLTQYPEHLSLFCNVEVQFGKIEILKVSEKVPSLTKSCEINAEKNPFQ